MLLYSVTLQNAPFPVISTIVRLRLLSFGVGQGRTESVIEILGIRIENDYNTSKPRKRNMSGRHSRDFAVHDFFFFFFKLQSCIGGARHQFDRPE